MAFEWRATNAPIQTRYDDIWFITPQLGWGVSSAGEIVHTEDAGATWNVQHTADAGTWLRCMTFTSATDGWVGSITKRQRLWKTEDGKTWIDMTARLPPLPSAICGISSPSKGVVFASGTQYPSREAAIMHTADGGQTWNSISMAAHANLLIDTYFVDDLHGWVVGGTGGTAYSKLKPVIMFTADGGKTWEDRLQNSGIDFPSGEWGWKIQFLTPQIGFVSLENDTAAAILQTTDGGRVWERIPIKDPQRNVELEGIGFINERVGWVGGWGHGFTSGHSDGTTSGTIDGGATWFDANGVGRFINRFRFMNTRPIIGYASGETIYQCTVRDDVTALALDSRSGTTRFIPKVWDAFDVAAEVPEGAKRLTITVFDPRQTLVAVLADEILPQAGKRTFAWNFKTDDGEDAGTGHFTYRVFVDGRTSTGVAVRPARAAPDVLANQVSDLIERLSPIAKRAHDDLVLPGPNGDALDLKALFDSPPDLMGALVRGGWVIPDEPDRSMFLVAIIGTGPMQEVLSKADIQLLTDWIASGAHVPPATKRLV